MSGGSKIVTGCGWLWVVSQFSNAKTLQQKVQNVEHRSFTPLVMSANKAFGRECKHFNVELSEKMEGKRDKKYILVVSRVRQKIIFSIINLIILVIHESATVAKKQLDYKIIICIYWNQ